jgi:hypothetical protein
MAVYKIFPQKDSTIYSELPTANTGMDEILEVGGFPGSTGTGQSIRTLIQFDTQELQQVVDNKVNNLPYTAKLKLYLANAYDLPVDFKVAAYPIYSTIGWDNGTGKLGDSVENTTGVSWENRKANSSSPWQVSFTPQGVTSSYATGNQGGGTWYTASMGVSTEATQSFTVGSKLDLNIDITTAVDMHYSESILNEGFIVKLTQETDLSTDSYTRLKYFSANTNTIYPPCLEIRWDDSQYNTGSLQVLQNSLSTIQISNNTNTYTNTGKQRFKISAKPKYPARTFSTSSVYLTNYALPQESYWGIKDEYTEEMVVDFDNQHTKISCNETGPYFDIYMEGLQPERHYRILIKTTLDGSNTVVDSQNIFKVVRNG